jgi:hypothetical protein
VGEALFLRSGARDESSHDTSDKPQKELLLGRSALLGEELVVSIGEGALPVPIRAIGRS